MVGGISETLKMNMGSDPLNAQSFDKIDAILMQFYRQNLAPPPQGDPTEAGSIAGDVMSQATGGKPPTSQLQRPTSSDTIAKAMTPHGDKKCAGLSMI